jgi:hypothetical protein
MMKWAGRYAVCFVYAVRCERALGAREIQNNTEIPFMKIYSLILAFCLLLGLSACGEGPAEDAGESVDSMVDDAGASMEEAGEALEEAASSAASTASGLADEAADAMEEAADDVSDAVEEMEDEMEEAVDEAVEEAEGVLN